MNAKYTGLPAEDRALLTRLEELLTLAERRGAPCFSSFLNEREQALARQYGLVREGDAAAVLYGGFADAQRRVFCALPHDWWGDAQQLYDLAPVRAVTLQLPKGVAVGHRDVLGSLMGLQLKRETIGDILIGEREAVVFALQSAAALILLELTKIGRVGVHCREGMPQALPAAHRMVECEGIVSSLRLDCVVALLCSVSRGEAVRLLSAGAVRHNDLETTAVATITKPGDTVSVRGHGKYKLDGVKNLTKKGRLHINYQKFD